MNYLIKGEFNKGLNVFRNEELVLSSRCRLIGFNKREISILDNNEKLILTLTEKDNLVKHLIKIEGVDSKEVEFVKRKGISYKGFLKILNEKPIMFKYNPLLFFNPYINIYFGNIKTGFVKKSFFKLKKDYFVQLDTSLNYSYHIYILIYLLMFETVFDHE